MPVALGTPVPVSPTSTVAPGEVVTRLRFAARTPAAKGRNSTATVHVPPRASGRAGAAVGHDRVVLGLVERPVDRRDRRGAPEGDRATARRDDDVLRRRAVDRHAPEALLRRCGPGDQGRGGRRSRDGRGEERQGSEHGHDGSTAHGGSPAAGGCRRGTTAFTISQRAPQGPENRGNRPSNPSGTTRHRRVTVALTSSTVTVGRRTRPPKPRTVGSAPASDLVAVGAPTGPMTSLLG